MSRQVQAESLVRIRDEARILVEQASDHQDHLEALVADAETDLQQAEALLSHALDPASTTLGHLRSQLRVHLQRCVVSAYAARQLLVHGRQQHLGAARLLSHVDMEQRRSEPATNPYQDNAVLVVDDYQDVRELVARVLQHAGFVVRTAANGLEALLAAYAMRPAVIVMDVTMPVLGGVEATRLIKAIDATRHARVIAYTGDPTQSEMANPTLFAAVIQKPARTEDVVAAVRQVVGL